MIISLLTAAQTYYWDHINNVYLSMIMYDDNAPFVILNGKKITRDDRLGKHIKIMEINKSYVLIKCGSQLHKLGINHTLDLKLQKIFIGNKRLTLKK